MESFSLLVQHGQWLHNLQDLLRYVNNLNFSRPQLDLNGRDSGVLHRFHRGQPDAIDNHWLLHRIAEAEDCFARLDGGLYSNGNHTQRLTLNFNAIGLYHPFRAVNVVGISQLAESVLKNRTCNKLDGLRTTYPLRAKMPTEQGLSGLSTWGTSRQTPERVVPFAGMNDGFHLAINLGLEIQTEDWMAYHRGSGVNTSSDYFRMENFSKGAISCQFSPGPGF